MRWAYLLLVASTLWWSSLWWAAPAAEASGRDPAGPVAFIGVPALHWDDIDARRTPNLWALAGQSGVGSVSVKAVGTVTCPFDGWLSVSAGVRSAVGHACGLPPEPERQGTGARVPGFADLLAETDGAYAGTLGSAVHAAGQCTTAVGRGAALALADHDGKVDFYADSPADLADWSRCRVIAVDVDELISPYLVDGRLPKEPERLTPGRRQAAVSAADAEVGAALAKLPQGAEVVLAGIGDHGSVPHLRAVMWKRAGAAGTFVGATSTRRTDIVVLPDIAPTIMSAAGVTVPDTVIGVPWTLTGTPVVGGEVANAEGGTLGALGEQAGVLRRADLTGTTVRTTTGFFFTGFAVAQVGFYVIAYLLLSRRRRPAWLVPVALGLASVPVSTYLINVLPWVRAGWPTVALVGGVLALAAGIAAVAVLGPWRRDPLGPPAVVAVVTGAVLLTDLLTGTTLQFNSLMGYTAVVGGRYYGLANIPFALLATALLMATAVAADHLVRAGRRRAAVGIVAGLGVTATLLAGWPGIGSDFGGVIAFVPGIAVTALLVAGRRVSILKIGAFCVVGGVAVSIIALLDHMRPAAAQTHLGRFAGQVFDGTFLPTIGRKLGAMLNTMLSPNLMPIVIAGLVFLVFAVLRPAQISAGVVPQAFARAPMLRAGLIGALVSGVVGMLVNDSGTAVLSMAVALAVPLVLTAGLRSPAQEELLGDPVNERGGHADVVAGQT